MSHWSNCSVILFISTYQQIPDFEKQIKEMLENAPKITGSEGNCDYTPLNFIEGMSTSRDCRRCPYLDINLVCTKEHIKEYYLKYCISGQYVDRCNIIITSKHGLRDKTKEETIIQFKQLIQYLKKYKNKLFDIEIICKSIV